MSVSKHLVESKKTTAPVASETTRHYKYCRVGKGHQGKGQSENLATLQQLQYDTTTAVVENDLIQDQTSAPKCFGERLQHGRGHPHSPRQGKAGNPALRQDARLGKGREDPLPLSARGRDRGRGRLEEGLRNKVLGIYRARGGFS